MKKYRDYYPEEPEEFLDYGQDTTQTEPLYADWSSDTAPVSPQTPEARERYYKARDAYYAERDAYYAEQDAYYAQKAAREKWDQEQASEAEYNQKELAKQSAKEKQKGRHAKFSYEDEEEVEAKPRRERKRTRRHHPIRNFIVFLLLVGIGLLMYGSMPVNNESGAAREEGQCNLLLVGTDEEGYRTDTLMLLHLDKPNGTMRLLSIPRDTYVPYYTTPKINSAYGAVGGGEAGMQELYRAVESVTGFAPDGYVMIDTEAFIEAIDVMGGIDYEVPMDMDYDDPDQDLHIHLTAGLQHLDGEQALGLVRFRSGYGNADIGRTSVQRDFIKAALSQFLKPSKLKLFPELWKVYQEHVSSSLSFRNLLWLIRFAIKADFSTMESDVLPGYSAMVDGASCYVLEDSNQLLSLYNPYT